MFKSLPLILFNFVFFISCLQPSIRDKDGNTPLHIACLNNDLSSVQALTLPISVDDFSKAYEKSDYAPLIQNCAKLPCKQTLEQKNFSGKSRTLYCHYKCTDIQSILKAAKNLDRNIFQAFNMSNNQKYKSLKLLLYTKLVFIYFWETVKCTLSHACLKMDITDIHNTCTCTIKLFTIISCVNSFVHHRQWSLSFHTTNVFPQFPMILFWDTQI